MTRILRLALPTSSSVQRLKIRVSNLSWPRTTASRSLESSAVPGGGSEDHVANALGHWEVWVDETYHLVCDKLEGHKEANAV